MCKHILVNYYGIYHEAKQREYMKLDYMLTELENVYYLCAEDYIALRVKELCVKHGITKYRLAQLTGISLAQFFVGEGAYSGLTNLQNELLETWSELDMKEQEILLTIVRSLKKR